MECGVIKLKAISASLHIWKSRNHVPLGIISHLFTENTKDTKRTLYFIEIRGDSSGENHATIFETRLLESILQLKLITIVRNGVIITRPLRDKYMII